MTRLRPVLLALFAVLVLAAPAHAGPLAGQYVVVLKDGVDAASVADKHKRAYGADVFDVYRHALTGYAARIAPAKVGAIRKDANVLFVTQDSEVFADGQSLPTGVDRIDADVSSTASGKGSGSVGVPVAVLDSGVDATHPDLNVAGGINCNKGAPDDKRPTEDPNGHGTGVAGVIAARDNGFGVVGVAPGAPLWSVRVLDKKGRGSLASLVCGVDWVTATRTDLDPANDVVVANMSVSNPGSDDGNCGNSNGDALHRAICRSVAHGITYVASAGNSSADFAAQLPAAYDEVLTVTAMADFDGRSGGRGAQNCLSSYTFFDDALAFFSNFAVSHADQAHTIAAPGVCIASTAPDGAYAANTGTSIAAPHVAGTAALCIASGRCGGTPAHIIQTLRRDAASFTTATPSYGFRGDPLRPEPGKYAGYLVRAAGY